MLRLIHSQSTTSGILVDDIDDQLPNKLTHRLGSCGDPTAYKRDGYANEPKQPCYISYSDSTDDSLPGFIDLEESSKVILSSEVGKVFKLEFAALITVVEFAESDLDAPVITAATLDDPAAGDVTIDGTGFLSVLPHFTSVRLVGAGVGDVTLSVEDIEAVAPGAVSDIEIVIDSTLIASLAVGDSIIVTADDQVSNTFVLT